MQLFVNNRVLEVFQREISKICLFETGGLLIGYRAAKTTVILSATGPGPNAKHSLFNFQRDIDYCNMLLEKTFYNSNGNFIYMGEWHTHPFGPPQPSIQDDREMIDISMTESYQNDNPILMIVRHRGQDLNVGMYRYLKGQREKLTPLYYD